MLKEQGTVVRIEADAIWVETVQTSSCGACRARAGCGQRVLAGMLSNASVLRVVPGGRDTSRFRVGDTVAIGIPESVVVLGSLGVYLLPLIFMLLGAMTASIYNAGEASTVLAALAGLLAGGALVRFFSWRSRHNPSLQPVLLEEDLQFSVNKH